MTLRLFASPDFWQQKSSLPAQPRVGAIAFALHGYGYVGTGQDSSGILLNDFWKYDASNDTWSQAAAFPGTARKNAVAFVTDSFAYAGTGIDMNGLTKDFYRYDDAGNSWQQVANLDSAGAVYARRDAASFAIGNKGYVVGGYDGSTFYSKDLWEFDSSQDTVWNEKTLFPLPGRRWATAFAAAGSGYTGMGYNYSQEYFHDLWKYNPLTGAWTQMADFPGNKRSSASVFVILDNAFVGTGFDGVYKNDFYRYDILNNAWSTVASYGGFPTTAASGFSVNGKGYVVCGIDSLGYKNELWEYTPDNTLGIDQLLAESVNIYPNPTRDYIELDLAGQNLYEFRLFDAAGNIVLSKTLSSALKRIDVTYLPKGIYYYRISFTEQKTAVTGKVVLQ